MAETKAAKDPKPVETIGQWIKAAQQKKNLNNPAFLRDTRAFLLASAARNEVLPILQTWDKTPITNKAIEAIFSVVKKYHVEKLESRVKQQAENSNWTVSVWGSLDLDSPETILYEVSFATGWEAEQAADRMLVKSMNHTKATIEARSEKTKLTIYRLDALARMFPKPKQAATVPTVKVSASRLSMGVGGQYNKPVYFSRG